MCVCVYVCVYVCVCVCFCFVRAAFIVLYSLVKGFNYEDVSWFKDTILRFIGSWVDKTL